MTSPVKSVFQDIGEPRVKNGTQMAGIRVEYPESSFAVQRIEVRSCEGLAPSVVLHGASPEQYLIIGFESTSSLDSSLSRTYEKE
jgi:hypothetical protein